MASCTPTVEGPPQESPSDGCRGELRDPCPVLTRAPPSLQMRGAATSTDCSFCTMVATRVKWTATSADSRRLDAHNNNTRKRCVSIWLRKHEGTTDTTTSRTALGSRHFCSRRHGLRVFSSVCSFHFLLLAQREKGFPSYAATSSGCLMSEFEGCQGTAVPSQPGICEVIADPQSCRSGSGHGECTVQKCPGCRRFSRPWETWEGL